MWRVGNGLVACLTYSQANDLACATGSFFTLTRQTRCQFGKLAWLPYSCSWRLQARSRCGASGPTSLRVGLVSANAPAGDRIYPGRLARARRSIHYLSQIGLYILLAWAIPDALASRFATGRIRRGGLQRRILGVTASVAIIVLAWCAHIQASYWRNGETLWSHAIAVTSENFIAHDGLGSSCLTIAA